MTILKSQNFLNYTWSSTGNDRSFDFTEIIGHNRSLHSLFPCSAIYALIDMMANDGILIKEETQKSTRKWRR